MMSQISNKKQNEFNYYFCFLDKVDFDCAWLCQCLVWKLSENNAMTKYELSNKQTKKKTKISYEGKTIVC